MKKIIYVTFIFMLCSCTYINEKEVISSEKIDLNAFLWKNKNVINTQSWTIDKDLEQIKNLEIKPDDIIVSWSQDNSWNEISEENINELIDILFGKN